MSDNHLQSIHILVVDDNQEILIFLKDTVLEPAGYRVSVAQDGQEGLEMALELMPDIILLDYDMPRMNGVQVLQALKRQSVTIPVILITSYGSETVAVDVFRLGVRDYVPKPFSIKDLLASIEQVLAMARLQLERDALFERLQRTNAELTHRLKQLDTLYRVSKSVTSLQARDKLLERIVDAALYLTEARDGLLVLLDPHTGNPTAKVLREHWDKSYTSPEEQVNIETHSIGLMMNVPLQIGDRVIGALTVSNKRHRQPLNQEDRRMLRMLGDYAAVAIENFRLLSEVEMRQQRERHEMYDLFRHYIPAPVIERILENPHNVQPGGEWQTISVLFADLRDFTTFSTASSPNVLTTILNRHLTNAADAILEEEGTLDKFMGDKVMAFFNAPVPQEDHALRAVRAAWYIHRSIRQMHQLIPVHQRMLFGIGVASGEAIVGNIGTPDLVNFTAIGHTVNKAHVLQEMAPGGRILICHRTYEMVKDAVQAQELPPIQIKGQQHLEPIYEVQGLIL